MNCRSDPLTLCFDSASCWMTVGICLRFTTYCGNTSTTNKVRKSRYIVLRHARSTVGCVAAYALLHIHLLGLVHIQSHQSTGTPHKYEVAAGMTLTASAVLRSTVWLRVQSPGLCIQFCVPTLLLWSTVGQEDNSYPRNI